MNTAIIVLGCHVSNTKMLHSRVAVAVNLYKQSFGNKILLSGGPNNPEKIPESKVMQDFTIKHGVPKKDIILEQKSIDTIENAHYSYDILKRKKIKSAIIVTSEFHIKRSKHIFTNIMKNVTLKFISSPNTENIVTIIKRKLHEKKLLRGLKKHPELLRREKQ